MTFDNIVFEPAAVQTEYGKKIYSSLVDKGMLSKIQRKSELCKTEDAHRNFVQGKRTLIIGARKPSKFETCKPSADFQLPIFSGCPGMCEYCYLLTRMGERSFVKVNVDIENIFGIANKYIMDNQPNDTVFELSASSDPLPFEPLTGLVSEVIEHFGKLKNGRLRICTKFEPAESILRAQHGGNVDFRSSINTPKIIKEYEHATPMLENRLLSAKKIMDSGYTTGIMIAPVFIYDGWKGDYENMLLMLADILGNRITTFEVVTHRFTTKAKTAILNVFPETRLDMNEANRKYKMGQFGYGKYIYTPEQMKEIKEFFKNQIEKIFPNSRLLYIV
jgi:spore photoproduct lyase